MFRQIAPCYDAMNHLLSLNIDRHWRNVAVRKLPWESPLIHSHPLLDVCTGTGDLALSIAQYGTKSGSSVEVIGSDFCAAMLQYAIDKDAPQMAKATAEQQTATTGFVHRSGQPITAVR